MTELGLWTMPPALQSKLHFVLFCYEHWAVSFTQRAKLELKSLPEPTARAAASSRSRWLGEAFWSPFAPILGPVMWWEQHRLAACAENRALAGRQRHRADWDPMVLLQTEVGVSLGGRSSDGFDSTDTL